MIDTGNICARGNYGAMRKTVKGSEMLKRWWLSWYQAGPDYRPINFPPNEAVLGWWCTGFTDEADILCALVQAESEDAAWAAVLKDWPDLIDHRFIEPKEVDYVIHSDRFPLSDWMRSRMVPADHTRRTW